MGAARASRVLGRLCLALAIAVTVAIISVARPASAAEPSVRRGVHEGVASCADSTCHSRQVDSGMTVRQNELITWQDRSSQAGAHSRAYEVLRSARGQAIVRKMGLKTAAQDSEQCLGCHSDWVPRELRGAKYQVSDGVGCEGCHGGSGGWLSTHYTVRGDHASNVARGMRALENPKERAAVCLDCHFGSAKEGQFVTHEIMAAGHPRVAFELELFSSLAQHWTVDADYVKRKGYANGVRTWAVGQAMAVERALTLYNGPRGRKGAFPELYFFDCHSCHRQISDDPQARPQWQANPGRPIPSGQPPFNDENMIMLSAVSKVVSPRLAAEFEANSRAFHQSLAGGDSGRAAARLAGTARALSDAFARAPFTRGETVAILDAVLSDQTSGRFTDYAGSAQAVMAVDTLVNALVAGGYADRSAVAARVRPRLNEAYAQVNDPNRYRPEAFRRTFAQVATAVRSLR